MEVDEILKGLESETGEFPRRALEAAVSCPSEITPRLLGIIEEAVAEPNKILQKERYIAHILAMYLLAQFREKKAYPIIIRFFSLPGKVSMDITGDFVTEDLCRVLASVAGTDTGPITRLIEEPAITEWIRSAALRALTIMAVVGEVSRDEVKEYFRELFNGKLERDGPSYPEDVWNNLVSGCLDLHATELHEHIEEAYREGLVNDFFISMDDVDRELGEEKRKSLNSRRYSLIEDVIAETEWWACWNHNKKRARKHLSTKSERIPKNVASPLSVRSEKIGRNAPCPCGSDKKYKKCCGRRA